MLKTNLNSRSKATEKGNNKASAHHQARTTL